MSETSTYPLRLPRSLKDEVARLSQQDGTSINQFVMAAVAAKVRLPRWRRRPIFRTTKPAAISRRLTGL